MSPLTQQIYQQAFAAAGYDLNNYHVDVFVLSEFNQVIIVHDHRSGRQLKIPVEGDVPTWRAEKVAATVVEALQDADYKEKGYK